MWQRHTQPRAFSGTSEKTAAGCGSGMREYGMLFRGEPEEERAEALGSRVVDVTVFLAALGLRDCEPGCRQLVARLEADPRLPPERDDDEARP